MAAGGRGLGVWTATGVAVTTTTTGVGVATGARGSAVTQPAANSSAADSAIAPNALPKEFGIFGKIDKFDNLSKFDRLNKFGKIDKFDKTFQSAPKFNVRLRAQCLMMRGASRPDCANGSAARYHSAGVSAGGASLSGRLSANAACSSGSDAALSIAISPP